MSDGAGQPSSDRALAHFALMPGAPSGPPSLDEVLRAAIRDSGAGDRFCPPEQPLLSLPEVTPPQREATPSPDLVAARREWLLGVIDDQRRLSAKAMAVQHRASDLSGQEFLDEFYALHRPVVIEGAAASWPAIEKWNPRYLAATVGGAPVEFQGDRTLAADFELAKDRHKQTMPFDAFIDMVSDEDAEGNEAYITAYNNSANAEAFAPLQQDLGTLGEFLTPGPGMLWVGPAGTFTPLHFDLTNNLLVQLCGLKAVTLVPPSQTRFMYHSRHVFSEIHDLDDPDLIEAYPLAQHLTPTEIFLEPGDALFVPIGWWHQVHSLEFSAMLTYTNFRWPNLGYQGFPQD